MDILLFMRRFEAGIKLRFSVFTSMFFLTKARRHSSYPDRKYPLLRKHVSCSQIIIPMLKNILRGWAQKLIGFDRYLYLFSRFNIYRLYLPAYEKEFSFFNGMINNDGAVLDIGANIGVMTVAMARKHPRLLVCSFEPVPACTTVIKQLVKSYRLNNVQLFETALGNRDGTAEMVVPKIGSAYLPGLSHVVEDGEASGKRFSVSMQKLDTIPGLQQLEKITAIKIDVENSEYDVLKGGELLLRKHRPIIFCELWDNERRRFCVNFLESLGYRAMVYEKGRLVDFAAQKALNFFFLP